MHSNDHYPKHCRWEAVHPKGNKADKRHRSNEEKPSYSRLIPASKLAGSTGPRSPPLLV